MLHKTAWFFALLFSILVIYLRLSWQIIIVEVIMYFLLITAGLIFVYKKNLPDCLVVCFSLSALPHFLGLIPLGANGRVLYDDTFIIANYDLLSHTIAFVLFSIGFLSYLRPKVNRFLIMFLALMGVGMIIEISEFLGYILFGIGKGWLAFGHSDSSANFGPWGDSMMDSISNMVGIILGFVIYILRTRIKLLYGQIKNFF